MPEKKFREDFLLDEIKKIMMDLIQYADMIMESMKMLPRIVVIMFELEGIGLQTSIKTIFNRRYK